MVADLVDQDVADDTVHRLTGPVRVIKDGDTVEEDPVGQACGIPFAFEWKPDAVIQSEQIVGIADSHRAERFGVGEILYMKRHIDKGRAKLLRQTVPDRLSGRLEIFLRPWLT